MQVPRPLPTPRRVQEDSEPPNPGYCLDPFAPLWGNEPNDWNSDLARSLYYIAREIDEYGLEGDYIDDLFDLAHDIRCKICSWYEIGLKAWKIKLFKAWKKNFTSFKEFCETAIGRTPGAVNAWIRSARVMSRLIAAGFDRLPLNASIALELSKFSGEDLEEAWLSLCEEFADHEMTLEKVRDFLADPIGKDAQWKNVRIRAELWEKLTKEAARNGIPVNNLLDRLLENTPPESDENAETVEVEDPDDGERKFCMVCETQSLREIHASDREEPYYRCDQCGAGEGEDGKPRYHCHQCGTISIKKVRPPGRKTCHEQCEHCGYETETPHFAHRYRVGFAPITDHPLSNWNSVFPNRRGSLQES
ncbi:hypothetical protein V0288_22405 [Pannus brasiliensis CCIBt3594]|uniref:CTCHY-type domain-containing protein n=1 Tax=Pannus brasiliensis CCIBt3594 TaxID=1427578 RepID=A0AAW9R0V7_9CHRO